MKGKSFVILEDRALIKVSGGDSVNFLQGLISNDVTKVNTKTAIHAAFLTPQGKYLHDFFITAWKGGLLLDCEKERAPDLLKRLKLYKLRAKAALEDLGAQLAVAAISGQGADALSVPGNAGGAIAWEGGAVYRDPRIAALGARAVLPAGDPASTLENANLTQTTRDAYDETRLTLGVPDGSRDLVVEKSILLESGFDELNGVDWNKGCYMGQELTARTKYRGLVKKRLVPIRFSGDAPEPGAAVTLDGRDVGEVRSSAGEMALALIRLEALETAEGGGALSVCGRAVMAQKPEWASF